jgi:hypothetical protein
MTDKGLEKLFKELIRQTFQKPAKQIIISELDGGSRPFSQNNHVNNMSFESSFSKHNDALVII